MRNYIVLGAVAGAAAAGIFGAGVAHAAPNVDGMTWSDAQAQFDSWGMKARVSARVGDRLNEGDCIVTDSTMSAKAARGFDPEGPSNTVLVSLDCNGTVASATSPGYSAASPEGRKAIQKVKDQEWYGTEGGQIYCRKYEKTYPDRPPLKGCNPEE
jgi:hypothetical protein